MILSESCKYQANLSRPSFVLFSHLVVCEHPEDVDLGVGSESQALGRGGDDPGHERAVAETVVQRLLVGPVRPLTNLPEMGMRLGEARVKYGDLKNGGI